MANGDHLMGAVRHPVTDIFFGVTPKFSTATGKYPVHRQFHMLTNISGSPGEFPPKPRH